MAKVTGIGGVFFKSRSGSQLAAWYAKHLGVDAQSWGGAVFEWKDDRGPDGGATAWMVTDQSSDHFKPSESGFMINYRVDDLEGLLAQLRRDGVTILKGPESHENGAFAWLLDPDGNKIELWQPK